MQSVPGHKNIIEIDAKVSNTVNSVNDQTYYKKN